MDKVKGIASFFLWFLFLISVGMFVSSLSAKDIVGSVIFGAVAVFSIKISKKLLR